MSSSPNSGDTGYWSETTPRIQRLQYNNDDVDEDLSLPSPSFPVPGSSYETSTAFDNGVSNYLGSVSSSIRAHVYEDGLRYHKYRDGRYPFPNDETEQNRDDMKHAMLQTLMDGKHFYAPVEAALEAGGEALDLGTGTGIWAIEIAEKYPRTLIHGVDLSPIQPDFVPENVYFAVDDFEDEWVHPENSLDYIHIRNSLFSARDRRALFQRAYRHLKPGGYIEIQETHYIPKCDDGSITPSTPYALGDFLAYVDAGMRELGADPSAVTRAAAELRESGFNDVQRRQHRLPLGGWPRDRRLRCAGLFNRTAMMDGLRGLARRPLGAGLGWSPVQIEMFLVDVRKSLVDSKFHAWFPYHVVYARKPF